MFAILMAILPGMVLAVSAQEQDASEAVSANSPIPDAVQYTGEELIERTLAAYQGAKEVSGFWGFNGRCSTLVNSAIVALGINNPRIIRLLNAISNPCWLVYNIFMGSIPGMVGDSLVTLSVLIAIFRLDLFPKKQETA